MMKMDISPVTIEVAHAQSPPSHLVAVNVGPAVAQGTTAPARKRQGNVVVQGGNPAGPARKARAPVGPAASDVNSVGHPPAKKGRAFGVKRKKLARRPTPPTPPPIAPARPTPRMPVDAAAAVAPEEFDGMGARYDSSISVTSFILVHSACT